MSEIQTDQWFHCYDQSLKGLIGDASFCHPAKVALGLAKRIYQHAIDERWVRTGDLCLDPMAGVATFGLVAATYGLRWIGIELETRFVGMGQENIALHTREWLALGKPLPMLIQGDARHFCEIVTQASLIVSSPPYADSAVAHVDGNVSGKPGGTLRNRDLPVSAARHSVGYSQPSAIVSSPPYSDSAANDAQRTFARTGTLKGINEGHTYKPSTIITSPPFVDARQDTTRPRPPASMNGALADKSGRLHRLGACEYGSTPEQLGAMREGSLAAVITSPPYESAESNCATNHGKEGKSHWKAGGIAKREGLEGYGDTTGQVGNLSHETYWSEMAKVYTACYDVLPTGGHLILVLKGFVRRGVYQDLPMQTVQLLEHIGFTPLHYHRAMLSSPAGQAHLFDEGETRTSRKSFFRRLCEAKGAPVIDHEAVVCSVKA